MRSIKGDNSEIIGGALQGDRELLNYTKRSHWGILLG